MAVAASNASVRGRELQADVADLDDVAVAGRGGGRDGLAIDFRNAVAEAEVVAVGVAVDLRADGGGQPAPQFYQGDFGAANHGEFRGQKIFALVGAPAED